MKGIVTSDMKYLAETDIQSYQIDSELLLKPASFMDLVQEMAYLAAETMRFGYNDLQENHTAWVLSRIHFEFTKRPKWGDKVKLATWYKGMMGPFCLRDFYMKDMDDHLLIKGTSSWAVIDVASRSMVRGNQMNDIILPSTVCNDFMIETPAGKVVIPKSLEKEFVKEHSVAYSDIDMVGHTNNTRYLTWAMDCIDYDYLLSHSIKKITINFNHETKHGDAVTLLRAQTGSTLYIEGLVQDSQAFVAKIDF